MHLIDDINGDAYKALGTKQTKHVITYNRDLSVCTPHVNPPLSKNNDISKDLTFPR